MRRAWRVAILVVSGLFAGAGCGSFGASEPTEDADAPPNGADAGTTDAGADDGRVPSANCDHTKPFKDQPTLVALSIPSAQVFRVAADERTVFFQAPSKDNALEVYRVTREHLTENFGQPILIPAASSSAVDGNGASPYGDRLYFTSNREGLGGFDLYVASPSDKGGFTAGIQLTSLSSPKDDDEPYPSRDGTELWFTSDRGGARELWVARGQASVFTVSEPATTLNSGKGEGYPVLAPDGLSIYFGTLRDDSKFDIWTATRDQPSGPFGEPVPLDAVNTEFPEIPSGLSDDGCRFYFSRNTSGEGDELWFVERPK